MEKELVRKECSWCKKEFLGRTYQEFCTHFCSDKSYYWHRKRGLKREKAKNSFILQGGKIRKCKDMVAVNFIDDTNPLTMNNISESELQDEVHGTVRAE